MRLTAGKVLRLSKKFGRLVVGEHAIAHSLAKSKAGGDGIWPSEPICEVLEEVGTKEIAIGMSIGLYNSLRVHWRGPGGDQERECSCAVASSGISGVRSRDNSARAFDCFAAARATPSRPASWETSPIYSEDAPATNCAISLRDGGGVRGAPMSFDSSVDDSACAANPLSVEPL